MNINRNHLLPVFAFAAIATAIGLLLVLILDRRSIVANAPPLAGQTYDKIPTVVFLGDSYTAGAGAPNLQSAFVSRLGVYEDWSVVNLGRGGTGYSVASTIADGCGAGVFCGPYRSMLTMAKRAKPDVVIVSGGRNDSSTPPSVVRGDVHNFYRALRSQLPDAVVIATSPLWDDGTPPAALGLTARAVSGEVRAIDGYYVDIGQPLQGHPNFITSDGIHPNAAGHAAIAIALETALKRDGVPYAAPAP